MYHSRLNWPSNVLHIGGGGGGQSQQTETQVKNDQLTNQLLQAQLKQAQNPQTIAPIDIPKAPVYGPPPTQTSQDTDVIANQVRISAANRQGLANSGVGGGLAGDTGGFGGIITAAARYMQTGGAGAPPPLPVAAVIARMGGGK